MIFCRKQDSKELSLEFNQLATKFDNTYLSEYAGLCFLGVAKCNENEGDVEALLKGARMFRKSNDRKDKLGFIKNGQDLEGAHRCYAQALSVEKNPVLKACIIREFSEINKNLTVTSDFYSPCHRVHELFESSNESIKSNDYISALEKLTEITELFTERKCEWLYSEVLSKIEITRLLLLLFLDLPASRQSPSQIKLLERYSWNHETFDHTSEKLLDENLTLLLEVLVHSCQTNQGDVVKDTCDEISNHHAITIEQHKILENIVKKFNRI
jgi:hypothetical protein